MRGDADVCGAGGEECSAISRARLPRPEDGTGQPAVDVGRVPREAFDEPGRPVRTAFSTQTRCWPCGHRGGQDPSAVSAGEPLRRTLRVDRPHRGHRPDADFRREASAPVLPCMPRITTGGGRIGRGGCGRRAQHRRFPSRFMAMAGSGVDRSWAASSTSTRRQPETAGQAPWPCSGTRQGRHSVHDLLQRRQSDVGYWEVQPPSTG